MKNPSSGSRILPHGLTDRQTDKIRITLPFNNFVKKCLKMKKNKLYLVIHRFHSQSAGTKWDESVTWLRISRPSLEFRKNSCVSLPYAILISPANAMANQQKTCWCVKLTTHTSLQIRYLWRIPLFHKYILAILCPFF